MNPSQLDFRREKKATEKKKKLMIKT